MKSITLLSLLFESKSLWDSMGIPKLPQYIVIIIITIIIVIM